MKNRHYFKNKIFKLENDNDFALTALELFYYQALHNKIYSHYLDLLGIEPQDITRFEQIPHLPISFFKSQVVKSGNFKEDMIFTSSGTTSTGQSHHFVREVALYEQSFTKAFRLFYGNISNWCIIALLPSYLEREGSSLVYMVDKLIQLSTDEDSGFYLYEHRQLLEVLERKKIDKRSTLLFGVSFALLDLAGENHLKMPELAIVETGGMKGRRREMTRKELHHHIKASFGVENVHSEYGMTELLSQAYSTEKGRFKTPPWMKISIRDTRDPFSKAGHQKTGGINVMDLANIDSCAFIETEDLGRLMPDGSFEVLGRFDQAEVRGCNLLVV